MPNPMPRLPPVTMTLRMAAHQLSGLRDIKRGNEADRRGYLVRRERLAAELLDGLLQLDCLLSFRRRRISEEDIGDHERTRNRILLRLHQRQPHLRMGVQHGLDFLGMNLKAAAVDHAVAPALEV